MAKKAQTKVTKKDTKSKASKSKYYNCLSSSFKIYIIIDFIHL
jgi:hypothetical protein